jgi:hypothetical protein
MSAVETRPGTPSGAVTILVLCIHPELGEAFVQSVCTGASGGSGETVIENRPVHVEVLAGDPRLTASWDQTLRAGDAVALLVRFLDVISLDKIRAIYRRLPSERTAPLAVILFREEGEIDFKMSCPACGQKLWVRDTDVGKRGRCPNCKKAFKLPSQAGHLKSQLMLPDAVPALTAVRGKAASCRGALSSLLAYLGGAIVQPPAAIDQETLKKTTVRVQIQNGDG